MTNYRSELDGIRGISIIAVILYHLDLSTFHFSNGYLGVDVFLVLSGYLISRNIIRELKETGKIDLGLFFEKRSRRILPLLITLSIVCQVLFFFYLLPNQFIDLAKSSISALTLTSNFYWVNEFSEYSAVGAAFRPLLHTWSLSLEEQFYITAPFFFILAFKFFKKNIFKPLIVITIFSFILYSIFSLNEWGGDMAFYLFPFRIWQFSIGALAAHLEFRRYESNSKLLQRPTLVLFSFAALVSTLFLGQFTSYNEVTDRLIVTITSFTVIAFSSKTNFIGIVLNVKPLTYLGLISYSIYVWHYPLFFFARIKESFSSPLEKISILGASILISVISYYFIENLFRKRTTLNRNTTYSILAIGFFISVTLSTVVIINKGYPQRFGDFHYNFEEMEKEQERYWEANSKFTDFNFEDQSRLKVAVIGNSFALDIATAIKENKKKAQVYFEGRTPHHCHSITKPGLPEFDPIECTSNIPLFTKNYSQFDVVVIADNHSFLDIGNTEAVDELKKNINRLRKAGFKGAIVLVGFRPEWNKTPFEIALDYGAMDEGVNRFAAPELIYSAPQIRELDDNAKEVYTISGVYYYDLVDAVCEENFCPIIKDRKILYSDKYHFSLAGAQYFSNHLVEFLYKINEQYKKN